MDSRRAGVRDRMRHHPPFEEITELAEYVLTYTAQMCTNGGKGLTVKGFGMGPDVEAEKRGNNNLKAGRSAVAKVAVSGTPTWILVR